jgi:hypothetical protein
MKPLSYKILQGFSFVFFLLSFLFFALSHVVTVASKHVEVRNKEDQVIGDAWISHDYGSDQLLCFSFTVLAGIQFAGLHLVGRKIYPESK